MMGPKKEDFCLKNIYNQRKPLYFENTGSASSSKMGIILEDKVVQKLELEKKNFN